MEKLIPFFHLEYNSYTKKNGHSTIWQAYYIFSCNIYTKKLCIAINNFCINDNSKNIQSIVHYNVVHLKFNISLRKIPTMTLYLFLLKVNRKWGCSNKTRFMYHSDRSKYFFVRRTPKVSLVGIVLRAESWFSRTNAVKF